MMIAYKGFRKDLSCVSGRNRFQYKLGIWNEEPEANCRQKGFHCAENPLDCLTYYPEWDNAVYYIVLADGDIHEDGSDTKIACTRMKLVKQLSLEEFVAHSLKYISDHPFRKNGNQVYVDEAIVRNKFVIVRGKNPIAQGRKGNVLGFVKENLKDRNVAEIGLYIVDGEKIEEDIWYDICGEKYLKEGEGA